jgi:hypothetical protein
LAADKFLYDKVFNSQLEQEFIRRRVKTIFYTSAQVKTWYKSNIEQHGGFHEILLPSPSGQGGRYVGRLDDYKRWEKGGLNRNTYTYRLKEYQKYFF